MQIVTVNVPRIYLDALDKMKEDGLYPSRSEMLRVAIHDFIIQELDLLSTMLETKNPDIPNDEIIQKKKKPTKIDMRSIKTGW